MFKLIYFTAMSINYAIRKKIDKTKGEAKELYYVVPCVQDKGIDELKFPRGQEVHFQRKELPVRKFPLARIEKEKMSNVKLK